ncbi:MAG: hypothetical protein FRX48_09524 [Lasallia pustulata]|uniref:PLD phosphodiesterase domain-containing protein n=1 Tax=Lasallia pustulata TaxID=136370 RepID=A0A5M8PD12_9LECA|nr:MAG: hypothetical protein FRX48_09524 [Lasallia pustulata]
MVSQKVFDVCQGKTTISSELARDPTLAPGHVAKKLYGTDVADHAEAKHFKEPRATAEDLEKAYQCGKWGSTRPSELFLRIYHDVLCTLEGDPMVGMTSPPLMGSSGVVPLSIIAPLPDICRHMSNCIARAEKEVFLATNYWKASDASTLITNSLKELSRRAGERGEKAVVKIIYDRGNAKQLIDNHQTVSEKEYTGPNIKIPPPHEIPHIDMQVVNYHRPIFGTFHSKYMVVDRKIAILSSNNIQDNDNLEMMTHIEGPIVDSFYDMSLASWHNELKPPLPSHNSPAALGGLPSFQQQSHASMFNPDGTPRVQQQSRGDMINPAVSHSDQSVLKARSGGTSAGQDISVLANGNQIGYEGQDTTDGGKARELPDIVKDAQNTFLPEHTAKDPHYDPDIASEVTRAQSVLTPRAGETRMSAVTRHLNTTIQPDTKGNAPECAPGDEMITLIPHPTHEPMPMAMVCRKPWGAPNHQCVHVPQNEAFLSAIRNAERSVFIQTPNLNAEPLIPALLAAVRRGIQVYYYVCLGYNDAGELLPAQGGINEMISHKLYTSLNEKERENLHVFNYVAKDQTQPIHNKFKKRSCHIKLMIADEHIGIQGNGNQDTQSWYHSQEVNVMLDSYAVCAAWADGIRRNQNTHLYGAVSREDGCWRDAKGDMADGAIGIDPGRFSWAKGIVGAVQRVRGAGGF